MRSKKYFRTFLAAIPVALLLLSACDKLDEPYAKVKPKGNNPIDTTDTTAVTRKVLLEDYTGHTCPNCPQGAQVGQTLQETNGGRVIMISVHAGFYATPQAQTFTADYRTTAGTAWNNYFQFAAYPNGMVNRTVYNSNVIIPFSKWGEAIDALINTPPDAGIKITFTADTNTRQISADVRMKFVNDLEGTYNVTLCVLEDGIIGPQKNSVPAVGTTPIIYDYEFKDMLRQTVTNEWGDYVCTDPDANAVFTSHFDFVVNSAVKIPNASLVAFITDDATKQVIQVEKIALVP